MTFAIVAQKKGLGPYAIAAVGGETRSARLLIKSDQASSIRNMLEAIDM